MLSILLIACQFSVKQSIDRFIDRSLEHFMALRQRYSGGTTSNLFCLPLCVTETVLGTVLEVCFLVLVVVMTSDWGCVIYLLMSCCYTIVLNQVGIVLTEDSSHFPFISIVDMDLKIMEDYVRLCCVFQD